MATKAHDGDMHAESAARLAAQAQAEKVSAATLAAHRAKLASEVKELTAAEKAQALAWKGGHVQGRAQAGSADRENTGRDYN